ncbi:major facilitator superfamily protein [Bifidobacterium saguini DSM 23967]|uniref:Major facilitator superfamily protein n=2 Tax=Bifidobacterium saguini TaxID=762210 RepID=A0A087DEN0_9BIFI|nr:MFS transporter [Bifidobacterium saguini]KFI93980.1 major facilitator superfamily protein [Bifidobacterium saguini DSM 23967]QTB90294.1 MFS transporter [Bifidobacterium saguini]
MSTTRVGTKSYAAHPSPYRRLFALSGAKAFCISGAVARLPISMMSLGIVLALNHLYDNWTIAGTMSAVYVLAMSCVTPFYARAFDRFGQARVGRIALAVQIIAMLSFAFAALIRVPIAVLFVLAIIMGLTQFSFGALVRTRWAYALRTVEDGDQLLNTAYAMEAAIDEIVFILGPILAAWLATSVHPVSQLFVPTLACGIGGTIFFSLKSTQPNIIVQEIDVPVRTAEQCDGIGSSAKTASAAAASGAANAADQLTLRQLKTHAPKPKSVLLYAGVLPLLAVFIVFNMSFTSFDVSITATMKAMELEPFLGVQLAMFAVGSCVGALVFGSRQLKGSHWAHMVMFLALLTIGYVFFRLTMDNLILLGIVEILTGLTVSPLFATGNLIVKDLVPAESLTEGLSWVTTAGTVGTSIGSSVAGIALDSAGPHIGMMLPFLFTLAAVPIALCGWWLAKRRA